jgi:hypothetical protein
LAAGAVLVAGVPRGLLGALVAELFLAGAVYAYRVGGRDAQGVDRLCSLRVVDSRPGRNRRRELLRVLSVRTMRLTTAGVLLALAAFSAAQAGGWS